MHRTNAGNVDKLSGSEQKMWKNRKQGDAHEEKKINHRL